MDFNPDLLQALLEQDLGNPQDPVRKFRADSLKRSLLKKYVPAGKAGGLHAAALDNFRALNERVGNVVLSDAFLSSVIFLEWKRVVNDSFYSGDLQAPRVTLAGAFANGLCGPGTSVGASDCLFFTKMFNSHLTTTNSFLYDHYSHCLPPRWKRAEEMRLADFQVKVVPGSTMSSVPKNRDKNRTTCTEPILNMFYQLGIKTQIEAILRDRFNTDISTQPEINQRLARRGSLDGSIATIDMKDASDSISLALCKEILPAPLLRLLMYTRSPRAHVGRDLVELNMLSTMGNGFTFALMTWLFVALVRAIYNINGVRCLPAVNFGVFGDDIIVLTEHSSMLIDTLERAGMTVNVDKSFTSGPFRESCGGDFFLGHDVRGIYIQKVLHETHVYSAFNRLHFWALRHGFKLSSTLCYLKGQAEFRPVPHDTGVDAGFVVTTNQLNQTAKRGRNGTLKYQGYAFTTPKVIRCGDRMRNFHGGLIAFLGGYIRNDQMALRVNEDVKFLHCHVETGETPRWDFIGDSGFTRRDLDESWDELLSPS